MKSKKGGLISETLGLIFIFVGGFVGGYFFGDKIISIIRGWLHI